MTLIHTTERNSMSIRYPQTTTLQARLNVYLLLPSLRTNDSKKKGMRVSFGIYQLNHLPSVRGNKTVATVEELGDLWKSGAMNGVPSFVMK